MFHERTVKNFVFNLVNAVYAAAVECEHSLKKIRSTLVVNAQSCKLTLLIVFFFRFMSRLIYSHHPKKINSNLIVTNDASNERKVPNSEN